MCAGQCLKCSTLPQLLQPSFADDTHACDTCTHQHKQHSVQGQMREAHQQAEGVRVHSKGCEQCPTEGPPRAGISAMLPCPHLHTSRVTKSWQGALADKPTAMQRLPLPASYGAARSVLCPPAHTCAQSTAQGGSCTSRAFLACLQTSSSDAHLEQHHCVRQGGVCLQCLLQQL